MPRTTLEFKKALGGRVQEALALECQNFSEQMKALPLLFELTITIYCDLWQALGDKQAAGEMTAPIADEGVAWIKATARNYVEKSAMIMASANPILTVEALGGNLETNTPPTARPHLVKSEKA